MKRSVPLEAAAEAVCNQSSVPPLIFQLPPKQGRKILEDAQEAPVYLYPAEVSSCKVDTGKWGEIPVYFIAPHTSADTQNVIFYIHGGGWVFGSFHTHEKLVRELSARTNSLVVFPEYTRSPEVKYPVAIEQCYFVLSHLWDILKDQNAAVMQDTLTLAGDSVGGNMAIAMLLMKKSLLPVPGGNAVVLGSICSLHRRPKPYHCLTSSSGSELSEAFPLHHDYQWAGRCFAQRGRRLWRKTAPCRCGSNRLAASRNDTRLCHAERAGSNECHSNRHGCIYSVVTR